MKVNLYLMSSKGLSVLQSVISSGFKDLIHGVCIGQDSNVLKDYSEDIRLLCESSGVHWRYRSEGPPLAEAQYSIAVSWRWMLREVPNLIVIHDSLLPRYRGFSPLVSQLINGEPDIGVSAIWAQQEYDAGDIIYQASITIAYPIKVRSAIAAIGQCYNEAIIYILRRLSEGKELSSTPQNHASATYSLWRDDQDYWIDWHQSSERVSRLIDALGMPYKGARSLLNGKKIIIHEASALPDLFIENRCPGKVIRMQEGFPVVVCGSGLLVIEYAIYEETGSSVLPLELFRSRFSSPS